LSEKQSELCRRLDQFYAAANREDAKPSDKADVTRYLKLREIIRQASGETID